MASGIPDLPGVDSTLAFFREGYRFVGNGCDRVGAPAFRTRLMLRPVTCMRGPEAVRAFYRPGRMTRRGAMPASVVALLQDRGSVQTLDGSAHRVRKALFMDMMGDDRLGEARRLLAEEWQTAADGWRGRTVALRDELPPVMTRVALRWSGIDPEGTDVAQRAEELSAMIEGAGGLGPSHLRARWLRARSERWARETILTARSGGGDSVIARIARHRDADGEALRDDVAGVELLNVLRPIVAVARFVVFAAHALHVHMAPAGPVGEDDAHRLGEEVRRVYPFFPVIGGRVLQPFDWRGTAFAKGDWLLLDLYGTNHDSAAWPAPGDFRPDRHRDPRADRLVPQGGGDYHLDHRCPGEWLTMALLTEAILALTSMGYRVPPQDLDISTRRFPPWPADGMRIAPA
ncbi:fatty acid alpha hydroxylase [Pseudooceanicola batsensis HTCC2597]|uniref:Fatty acid alpha hydroxylase n=1 Tax=Pseudooceanicola batsensis (strain ATCC BAA-863 / DSM 15984 / KCTC 12145 / HTCC2597) TaxID=252305 RepID=A3U0F6_PSEBH|nr:cytochrome P450 [Pseudooceanicola batsensis]EAQ02247.1 fatty acid alpha hydroxylase [Pseudooceanicola batsensis HTCC2597]